jgi:hypothetical protein
MTPLSTVPLRVIGHLQKPPQAASDDLRISINPPRRSLSSPKSQERPADGTTVQRLRPGC